MIQSQCLIIINKLLCKLVSISDGKYKRLLSTMAPTSLFLNVDKAKQVALGLPKWPTITLGHGGSWGTLCGHCARIMTTSESVITSYFFVVTAQRA